METRIPATEFRNVRRCFRHKYPDRRFYELAEILLWRNKAVARLIDGYEGPTEPLNANQRIFATIALLDLEVPNGGLLQFFWNRPGWVDHVSSALRSIGFAKLASNFDRATAEMMSQMTKFSKFRKKDSLKAYVECAGQFDFDEFDSAYYESQEKLYARTVAFISKHLADFIAS